MKLQKIKAGRKDQPILEEKLFTIIFETLQLGEE
jgi:hypothetical protein